MGIHPGKRQTGSRLVQSMAREREGFASGSERFTGNLDVPERREEQVALAESALEDGEGLQRVGSLFPSCHF